MKHIDGIVRFFLVIALLAFIAGRITAQDAKPAPTQPIAAEKLQAFYVESLELQLAQERLTAAQKELDTKKADATARFNALVAAAKVNAEEWAFDLKAGKMTKKKAS